MFAAKKLQVWLFLSILMLPRLAEYEQRHEKSIMISNDQELIQSDPTPCPQNQKGNN